MELRAPTPTDAEGVHALIAARDVKDLGVPDFTLTDLREEWGLSDVELAKDAVVGEEEGALVAYAIARRAGFMVVVHPYHEGKGWGARLLEWTERRAVEKGHDFRRQWINAGNERARMLLEAAGYNHVRSYARMGRSLDAPVEDPGLPEGVELRALDPQGDAEAVYELDAAAFAGAPDFDVVTLEQFREEHMEAHDLDPALSFVAEREGALVGFLLSRRWDEDEPPAGYVSILAVSPAAQGAGIGTAMLLAAFRAFADAGLRQAVLGVSMENPGALRIYEGAGMAKRFGFETYERPLRDDEKPAGGASTAPLESPPAAGD
jgi:mycothiol synthase